MSVSPKHLKIPGDILEAALAREMSAHEFYAEALKHATNDSVRRLLEQLKDAEYKHVEMVKQKLAELRRG